MLYFYPPSDEENAPAQMYRYAVEGQQISNSSAQHGSHVIIDSADGVIPHMHQSSVSINLGGSGNSLARIDSNEYQRVQPGRHAGHVGTAGSKKSDTTFWGKQAGTRSVLLRVMLLCSLSLVVFVVCPQLFSTHHLPAHNSI
jgi:hypothetical protein